MLVNPGFSSEVFDELKNALGFSWAYLESSYRSGFDLLRLGDLNEKGPFLVS